MTAKIGVSDGMRSVPLPVEPRYIFDVHTQCETKFNLSHHVVVVVVVSGTSMFSKPKETTVLA